MRRTAPWLVLSALVLAACAGEGSGTGDETGNEKTPAGAAAASSPPAARTPVEEAVQTTPAAVSPSVAEPALSEAQAPAVALEAAAEGPATPPSDAAAAPGAASSAAFVAAGTSRLALELSSPFDLAGFELHLAFAPEALKAGQPVISEQLQGFLCAANPDIVGGFKYICAKVPASRAEGLLATVPISWSTRPPTLADFTVQKLDLVDVDSNQAPEGIELRLRVLD